jgi:hypothetical protein
MNFTVRVSTAHVRYQGSLRWSTYREFPEGATESPGQL